jgi:hypothetical protein
MSRFNYRTLPQQSHCIREIFPDFQHTIKDKEATWRGILRPSPNSPDYAILIKYKENSIPHVWVKEPKIDLSCKHLYPSDDSLCLYYPKDKEWTPKLYIAYTIIPWTAEWLIYYEIWKITGIWYGEEAPHGENKSFS